MTISKIYSDLTSGVCTDHFSKMTGAKQVETVAKTVGLAAASYILAGTVVAAFVGIGAFAYMTSQYGTFDRIRDYANQGYEGAREKVTGDASLSREVAQGIKELQEGGKKLVEEMEGPSVASSNEVDAELVKPRKMNTAKSKKYSELVQRVRQDQMHRKANSKA